MALAAAAVRLAAAAAAGAASSCTASERQKQSMAMASTISDRRQEAWQLGRLGKENGDETGPSRTAQDTKRAMAKTGGAEVVGER